MQLDEFEDDHTFGKSVFQSKRPGLSNHCKINSQLAGNQHKLGEAPNLTKSGPGVEPGAARLSFDA